MSSVALLSANLITTVLETLFYGAYVVLATSAVYLTVTRKKGRTAVSSSKMISGVALLSVALFGTVTAHWILNVARLFLAFHNLDDPLGPRIFYADLSHATEVTKYGFLVAALFIGDLFLIHRTWAIWGFCTRIIIFPTLTLVGFTTFGVGLTYQLSTYNSTDNIFKSEFRRWTTGICFFSLSTTAYTTAFVWYKLWETTRTLKELGIPGLASIIRIFVDSAALLCAWGLFHVISYQCGSNLQFIAVDCTPVLVGISNILIHLRLHFDFSDSEKIGSSHSHQIEFADSGEGAEGDIELGIGSKRPLSLTDV
ncbi:hypothetical protein B0H16DRAFT_1569650 [Mycena metata]|uniref:Uncharacterized protein n=1 Tax=Mycena metata TaxID=1033252 RepID=A0AAD7IC68_9AGAR|nr:hypothetical protein B0H16DRAFT_1569650 [Mycena metata]